MNILDLQPQIVWKFFNDITMVPRPSKHEDKMISFLESFAKEYNIEIKKDHVGNILMSKPATKGYEHLPSVVLQSHMDMVCDKIKEIEHDFINDPIETIIENGWIKANGTTLGADNGIGVATELAILASNDIQHGPIECLFTVDEETGLTGADAIQPGFVSSNLLINLDSEEEGLMYIGCAGGIDTVATFEYQPIPAPMGMEYFRIDVQKLNGGHSGGDIHKGLGNANIILVRFLYQLLEKFNIVLCHISGGSLRNAISRDAHAIIGLQLKDKDIIFSLLDQYLSDLKQELIYVDPDVEINISPEVKPADSFSQEFANRLVRTLYACPHGVIGMSHAMDNLVETSTNFASIKMTDDNKIVVCTSQRSSNESCKVDIKDKVSATFQLGGAIVSHGDGYPGWNPNPNSKLLKVVTDSYERLFNRKPLVLAIHAGLECGLFLQKYPQMDMISFGPTLLDVHSPNERMEIATVELFWKHLLDILVHVDQAIA